MPDHPHLKKGVWHQKKLVKPENVNSRPPFHPPPPPPPYLESIWTLFPLTYLGNTEFSKKNLILGVFKTCKNSEKTNEPIKRLTVNRYMSKQIYRQTDITS